MKVKVDGIGKNNMRSVIDLKGAYKLVMFLPKAAIFRSKIAEVPAPYFSLFLVPTNY